LAAIALGAFIAGVAASSAVIEGEVDPGVVVEMSGTTVESVSPVGLAWRAGIRPGQRVVLTKSADEVDGWRIETSDGPRDYVVDAITADGALQATWPLAIASLVSGAFSLLLLRARRRWVLPAACFALVLAGPPMVQSGNVGLSTVELAAAAIVPGGWAIWRLPGGVRKTTGLAGLGVVLLAIWAAGQWLPLEPTGTLEWFRNNAASWATAVVFFDRGVGARLGAPVLLTRPRPFDVAALAVVAGIALGLVELFAVPPLIIAVLAAAGVLSIPTLRRRLRPVENVLLADVRAQAAAEATEQERGRLARELHDVPLQELFGVIRRLEVKPGTESESDDLRALASHLRNVAIDLRPPVLDDLGLPAALEYLAESATTPARAISVQVDDHTGLAKAQRPPEAVELAMFRIAMEAVTNAVAHSSASEIAIVADVAPARVELSVADNGAGLDSSAVRAAVRAKHMGLNSMRRRADAIDAEFSIKSSGTGTRVTVAWQA
jgi:signal transduction histidine kinase